MNNQVMTVCVAGTEYEGKCCSAGNPHNVYSVCNLCSSLDLKALSDSSDLQGYTTTNTDMVSNARSSSVSHHSCRLMHIPQDRTSTTCSQDPNITPDHSRILQAQNILGFALIQEKDNIDTKLLTWLMKKNILLIFPFTCSHAYSEAVSHKLH